MVGNDWVGRGSVKLGFIGGKLYCNTEAGGKAYLGVFCGSIAGTVVFGGFAV
jgi:hypothetical protein